MTVTSKHLMVLAMQRSPHLTLPPRVALSASCASCFHVREKPLRLASEQSHRDKKRESPRGGTFRVVFPPNDRTNWKAWMQERARFGH